MEEDKPKKKRKKQETAGERKPRSAQRDALHAKNWKEYMATVEDIQNFLMDRILLRHNVITGRVEYRLPSSYEHEGTDWQPINDRIVNSLWAELSATKVVRVQDMYRVIESDFVPEFHPFRYNLEHLPPWDGQNHILLPCAFVGRAWRVYARLPCPADRGWQYNPSDQCCLAEPCLH